MKPNRKILIYMNMFLLPLLPLALCFCAFFLPPQYEESFMGELKYKCNRLNKTDGNRIIFVGGSGAAFGIDCALVENAFPTRKAVNFGSVGISHFSGFLGISSLSIQPPKYWSSSWYFFKLHSILCLLQKSTN